jgi:hypothetical protein
VSSGVLLLHGKSGSPLDEFLGFSDASVVIMRTFSFIIVIKRREEFCFLAFKRESDETSSPYHRREHARAYLWAIERGYPRNANAHGDSSKANV